MKKHGILQHELSEVIATLGHTDSLVIADAGLPIPPEVKRIDLAITEGVPKFMQVLGAILQEVQVERVILAREMGGEKPPTAARTGRTLGFDPGRGGEPRGIQADDTRCPSGGSYW
jgi:D-ribose pyranase